MSHYVYKNIEWVESPDGAEYTMRLAEHEVDIILKALWYYQAQFSNHDNRQWQLTNAIRQAVLRAGVEVIWSRERLEALGKEVLEGP